VPLDPTPSLDVAVTCSTCVRFAGFRQGSPAPTPSRCQGVRAARANIIDRSVAFPFAAKSPLDTIRTFLLCWQPQSLEHVSVSS
jgi:hypothetical protein